MASGIRAAVVGLVAAVACATAPRAPPRVVLPPRPADPDCVARAVLVPPSIAARGGSFRTAVEFWVEPDGSAEVVEAPSWVAGLGVEENQALANEVAAAVARCAWLPGTVDGVPARTRAALPLRFAADEPAEPAPGPTPVVAATGVRPAREVEAGCVERAVRLLAAGGPRLEAVVAVAVEGEGGRGPVRLVRRAPGLDEAQAQEIAVWVAKALEICPLVPGTVGGRPARTLWMSEIRTGP